MEFTRIERVNCSFGMKSNNNNHAHITRSGSGETRGYLSPEDHTEVGYYPAEDDGLAENVVFTLKRGERLEDVGFKEACRRAGR